jgi:murein L,D-transpeptidase YcbB/YkuD
VADDGRVSFKPDVYGRDASLLAALDRPRPVPLL